MGRRPRPAYLRQKNLLCLLRPLWFLARSGGLAIAWPDRARAPRIALGTTTIGRSGGLGARTWSSPPPRSALRS